MIWSLVLAAVGIAGLWLAGKKNSWGWAIGLAAQVLWVIYALVTQQYGFIISALAYGFVYAKNFIAWRTKPLEGNFRGQDMLDRTPPKTEPYREGPVVVEDVKD